MIDAGLVRVRLPVRFTVDKLNVDGGRKLDPPPPGGSPLMLDTVRLEIEAIRFVMLDADRVEIDATGFMMVETVRVENMLTF